MLIEPRQPGLSHTDKQNMRYENGLYALTLYDNNPEPLKHIWFDIDLRVIEPSLPVSG